MNLRNAGIVVFLLAILSGCYPPQKNIQKDWLEAKVDFEHLTEQVNTYHMFDTTGSKVGSMIFGWKFMNGSLVARDTSQFDNGSVYETAEMILDTGILELRVLNLDMQMALTSLSVDLAKEGEKLSGNYIVKRDSLERITMVDSSYAYDVFREEIYAVLHALDFNETDTINLKAFISTGLTTANVQIFKVGIEDIKVAAGNFDCDVVWLEASGPMPSNKIWISRSSPRRIVKFYVPGPELSIELVD